MEIDVYVGQIVLFPYNFIPSGWMACEGQLLAIGSYQVLYSLIGHQYGGDGINTFALPDLSSAAPLPGMRYCIALLGVYPARD